MKTNKIAAVILATIVLSSCSSQNIYVENPFFPILNFQNFSISISSVIGLIVNSNSLNSFSVFLSLLY